MGSILLPLAVSASAPVESYEVSLLPTAAMSARLRLPVRSSVSSVRKGIIKPKRRIDVRGRWQNAASVSSLSGVLRGRYDRYQEGVLTDGKTKILFFYADWCKTCKTADNTLRAWYNSDTFPVSTYKIEFDKAGTLVTKFGVQHEGTFIKVDGQGNRAGILENPDDFRLQDFIRY